MEIAESFSTASIIPLTYPLRVLPVAEDAPVLLLTSEKCTYLRRLDEQQQQIFGYH